MNCNHSRENCTCNWPMSNTQSPSPAEPTKKKVSQDGCSHQYDKTGNNLLCVNCDKIIPSTKPHDRPLPQGANL